MGNAGGKFIRSIETGAHEHTLTKTLFLLALSVWVKIWNMVKYFFDPKTRAKIELWSDPDGLTEFIDRETLDDAFNADIVDPSILFKEAGVEE